MFFCEANESLAQHVKFNEGNTLVLISIESKYIANSHRYESLIIISTEPHKAQKILVLSHTVPHVKPSYRMENSAGVHWAVWMSSSRPVSALCISQGLWNCDYGNEALVGSWSRVWWGGGRMIHLSVMWEHPRQHEWSPRRDDITAGMTTGLRPFSVFHRMFSDLMTCTHWPTAVQITHWWLC